MTEMSFIIIFGTLSFHIKANESTPPDATRRHETVLSGRVGRCAGGGAWGGVPIKAA